MLIKAVGVTVIILLALYVLVGVGLYVAQRQLIYYPQPYTQDNYPQLTLSHDAGQVSVLCLNTTPDCQPKAQRAVLYFGGNTEAVITSR